MRKLIAGTVAVLALAAVTGTSAGAQTVSKFTVETAHQHGHRVTGGFEVRGLLVEPGNRHDVDGSFKATFSRQNGSHVRGVFFFPDGKIKANGDQNHSKVPIVGGTRRWNGASGKLKIQSLPGPNVLLTFTVVQ